LLVVTGSLLLASNLFGFSLAWLWTHGIVWVGQYWPLLLIVWGGYKVYQRMVHPETARVGAGEILLLFFIVFTGLTIHFTRRLVTGLPLDVSIDDVIESIDSDISFGPAYSYSEEDRFELPQDTGLLVENARGAVTVVGWDEQEIRLKATKRIYRHSEEKAAEIAETIRPRFNIPPEGAAKLEMETPSDDTPVETDLELWIPRRTALTVSNRRGPLSVSGISAPVGLATSQDSIEVRDITGRLSVEGRRGPVRLERITGDVEARNRYGTMTISEVDGDLIGETSNGSLTVEGVTGTARLTNRHSQIRASDIRGDLTVEASHTEVRAESLGATATIETSYRPIFVKGIEGRLSIEARSSEIEVREVDGDLDISNTNRSVTAVDVGGGVTLTAKKCEIRLDEISGPIEVESSYHPVHVRSFQASLNVHSEYAPLQISTDSLDGEINLTTTYGEVRLTLPPESSFRLDSRVKGGNILSDFRQSTWEESRAEDTLELRGTAGDGASPIVIETSYGDIRILEAGSQ
jgi:DUF4097 and DUF4098 domain-containing protein YvlB